MGQRDSFSSSDIQRIRIMYECDGNGGSNLGGAKPPGKPIGTNKPRPSKKPTSSSSGGIKPIKPIKPIRPIKPVRPASGGGGANGPFGGFLANAGNAAQQFMQGVGSNFQSLGSNLMNSIGFDEAGKETGRSES